MSGPVALVGAGEFLPEMRGFDASLLAATGRSRPRVAILPTASYPDGEEVFTRWATMGVAHFGELGAEVEPVLVRDRAGADDPPRPRRSARRTSSTCRAASPAYLLDALAGSAVGRALTARTTSGERCSRDVRPGRWSWPGTRSISGSARCRGRCAGGPGSGSRPGASVVPHYDAWPEALCALVALQSPRGRSSWGSTRRRPRVAFGVADGCVRRFTGAFRRVHGRGGGGRAVSGEDDVPQPGSTVSGGLRCGAITARRLRVSTMGVPIAARVDVVRTPVGPAMPRDQSGLTVRKQSEQ